MKNNTGMCVYKKIYKSFQGISPTTAKEICIRSNIDCDEYLTSLTENDFKNIWIACKTIKSSLESFNYRPSVITTVSGEVLDFTAVDFILYNQEHLIKVYKDSTINAIEDYYFEKNKNEKIRQKSTDLNKLVNTRLERLYNKLEKQIDELNLAKDLDIYKLYGELILSNLYRINKGMKEIEVENYYDSNLSKCQIPLDQRLSPEENSQYYYKKYNKMKNAIVKIQEQVKETKEEIEYLENVLVSLEGSEDFESVEEIRDELAEQGFVKTRKKKKNLKKNVATKPNLYISSDGFSIQAGKNNNQNDYLTLKKASKADIWLHTKDIPGSHVIIITEGKEVPHSTLLEAASIAAYHSKGKLSSNVPVDYTLVKHVRKPSGAKPGMVIYDHNKTVYVTPDINIIKNLEASK